jgi:hypothetical protein
LQKRISKIFSDRLGVPRLDAQYAKSLDNPRAISPIFNLQKKRLADPLEKLIPYEQAHQEFALS